MIFFIINENLSKEYVSDDTVDETKKIYEEFMVGYLSELRFQ